MRPVKIGHPALQLSRNFRFDSPISTPPVDQTASLVKVLAQFWSTVPPAAPGWVGLASRGHATRINAVGPIDCADTSPSPYFLIKNLLRCAGRLSGWHRQRLNPLQHAAKQPPRQVALRQQQPIVAGVFNQTAPVFTSRCCKLVSDQLAIPAGSASRRHRLPRL